jgi:hypothetical protein
VHFGLNPISQSVIARNEAISMLYRSDFQHRFAYVEIASLPLTMTL